MLFAAPAGRDLPDRQSRRVSGKQRARPHVRDHPLQQRVLDLEILGDRLHHPVALGEFRKIVFEISRRDERGQPGS